MWSKEEQEFEKGNKRVKRDSDNDTVKLSDDEHIQTSPKHKIKQERIDKKHE